MRHIIIKYDLKVLLSIKTDFNEIRYISTARHEIFKY